MANFINILFSSNRLYNFIMFIRLAIFIQLALLCTTAFTQSDAKQYQFRRIDIAKGLSSSQITCILKDSKGFMWFGTMSGLNRYDGCKFKVFKHNTNDSSSIDNDYITRIMELPDGKLLIETRNASNIYNAATEKFEHNVQQVFNSMSLPISATNKIIKSKQGEFYFFQFNQGLFKYNATTKKTIRVIGKADMGLYDITQNINGDFWLLYYNGEIKKMDGKTNQLVYASDVLSNYNKKELLRYTVTVDSEDQLWIYAAGETKGVYNFNATTNQLIHLTQDAGKHRLNTNLVRSIIQADENFIWICTDHGGINVLNKKDYSIQYIVNNPDDNNSLSQNTVTSSYRDDEGIIWICTFKKGINCYHESIIKFPLFRHQSSNANSLSYDDVNRFAEDEKGNIWIGTNGGGLIYYNRQAGSFTQYKHQPGNSNSLSNDVIVSLCIDSKQKLWIGTYFGGMDCFDGKTFTHYKHDPANANSIANNNVWEIYEDKAGNMWVGTLGGGLDRFDRDKNIFYHNTSAVPNTIHSNFISVITENKEGDIWIGTAYGVSVLQKSTGNFTSYLYKASDPSALSNNNVQSIYIDAKSRVWVGTREGLNLFNAATKTFQHFAMQDGLPDNSILDILEDNNKNIWISTSNGISSITVAEPSSANGTVKLICKNFNNADGLQGTEFNDNAAFKTRSGELIFGGANGFNIFNPEKIKAINTAPRIVFTNFEVFNKTIIPEEAVNGKAILTQSINETQKLELKYNQNDIAIEFAALNFFNPEKNNYAYKLEGFKNEWILADSKIRKAVFTNLDPGTYTFYVKIANDKGGWNDNVKKLQIKILPPFWRTNLAYALYALIIITALYIGRRMIISKAKLKFAIEQERIEAQRMHELDLMKIKFFTNVSHEFRTPLSLILAPLDKMLKQPSEQTPQLQLIHRNARRLLNLVNQLLDFRKMEEKELKLQVKQGDIVQYISDVAHFFSDVADKKSISFSFHTNRESLQTHFDHDKIERILFNLLSNAFKFTPENGHVGVEVKAKKIEGTVNDYELQINVLDTGIGIELNKQEKIFERFFQNDIPGSMVNQGSGIGLAITKEFVNLHGGTITLESEPDKGSCFIIHLLLTAIESGSAGHIIVADEAITDIQENSLDTEPLTIEEIPLPVAAGKPKQQGKKATVLLVEDHDDFRFYLKDNLKEFFIIVEAVNGKQGWQKALAAHPDLIVSDISMPEMTGTELCKKLKNDQRTTHIPVILLTALAGEEQQLKGLATGASDYMTKPFNFEILHSKIKNQLAQKEQFKKTYQKQVEVRPSEVIVESATEKFMQQLMALIEKNMAEPEFSVEDMSREMFMSRVALYKKLLSLTGKTPIEFLRQVRLKRAAALMEKSKMTVAEVAYEVGFNNPKYFSKYFKTEFGKLPSAYMEEIRKEKLDNIEAR
jgi:signal transduction histidine kinase/ligand-binding sensor domain-containing protein/DNA-binding response OmpR family regulator